MPLVIAHVSDIHFGGYGAGWDEDEDQRKELVRDLKRLLGKAGRIDGVIVGGDIAFAGKSGEYDLADQWISDICEAGKCSRSQVWTVPGNHDLDWKILEDSRANVEFRNQVRGCSLNALDNLLRKRLSEDADRSLLLQPLSAYNRFAHSFGCDVSTERLAWFDDSLVVDGLPVRLTGLNSAFASDRQDSDTNEEYKLPLGTAQCRIPRADGLVHITFCHHPPNWIRDWTSVEPYLRRAHLLLFGHEHKFAARQEHRFGTVEVFAGAVGPERLGDPEDDKYSPAWNLLSLHVNNGNHINISVNPRVWYRKDTHFDLHPDGINSFTVHLDLESLIVAPTTPSEAEPRDLQEALPASPLEPEREEVEPAGVPADAEERRRRRRLGVDFVHLTPTEQIAVARRLGIVGDDEVSELLTRDSYRELLRRVRDAGLIDRLAEELNA